MPKRLTIAQAQQQLPSLPSELTQEPVIITQDDVPVMVALSYTHLTALLETLDILTDPRICRETAPEHHSSSTRYRRFLRATKGDPC